MTKINGPLESNNILDIFKDTDLFYDNLLSYKVLAHSEVDIYQKEHYHVPVVCEFSLSKSIVPSQSKNQAYNIEKADWNRYKSSLNEMFQSFSSENECPSSNLIEECMVNAAKMSIPLVKKTSRKENLPSHIVDLKRLKNYWQRRYHKNKDESSHDNFYTLKDAVKQELYQNESDKIKRPHSPTNKIQGVKQDHLPFEQQNDAGWFKCLKLTHQKDVSRI